MSGPTDTAEFPPSEAKSQVQEMLTLREAGMTVLDIAIRYEINAKSVYNLIKKYTDIDMALVRKEKAEANRKEKHRQFYLRERHGFKWMEYKHLVKIGATKQFSKQRGQAKDRGIAWEFTFEQWWKVWNESGHYEKRGVRVGQYVMARFNDIGPYSTGNVEIVTCSQNVKDLMARQKVLGRINLQNLKSYKKGDVCLKQT